MIKRNLILAVQIIAFALPLFGQTQPDPTARRIDKIGLVNETIFDGLAKLNASTDLGYTIEYILKPKLKAPSIEAPTFTSELRNVTVAEVLDWLCRLDSRYAWNRDGATINVFPRDRMSDEGYFMNRRITQLQLRSSTTADGTVVQALSQLPPPKEQIASMQVGGNLNFPKPWTAEFKDISVREVANRAAERLGTGWGWQITGSEEFRLIIFHRRLEPMDRK